MFNKGLFEDGAERLGSSTRIKFFLVGTGTVMENGR